MAGNPISSLANGIINALKSLVTGLGGGNGGEGGGRPGGAGYDPTKFMKMLQQSDDIEKSFSGPDQKVERAVSGVIKDSIMEFSKTAAATGEPTSAVMLTVAQKMPEMLKQRGLDSYLSDYSLKGQGALDQKVDSVVAAFNATGDRELMAMASQVGQVMREKLGKEIPQTPAQKNGLDLSEEIDQHVNNQFSPKPELAQAKNQTPSGPSM